MTHFNPLNASPTKWSNTLKQFVGKLPTNCLSVFDHFVGLALKWLKECICLAFQAATGNANTANEALTKGRFLFIYLSVVSLICC